MASRKSAAATVPVQTDKKSKYPTIEFYGGKAIVECVPAKKPNGEAYTRFRIAGRKDYVLSSTRITGKLDKSRPLMIWQGRLISAHLKGYLEGSRSEHFLRDELIIQIDAALKAPDTAKEDAGDVGRLIHEYAHDFAKFKLGKGDEPDLDKLDESNPIHAKALNGISAFLEWYNNNKVEFLEMETPYYYNASLSGIPSSPLEYIGVIDLVAKVNGDLEVLDYKSSKGIYSEQQYQTSSYLYAYNAQHLKRPAKRVRILNFNKETGELLEKAVERDEVMKDFDAFFGLYLVACRERELGAY